MKKALVILIFVVILFSKNDNVFAQTDSLKVEYKQESIDSSDFSLRRKYKYLDIIMKEEKNLIKIGIQPALFSTGNTFELTPHLVFEKKVSPEWSIIIDNEVGYSKKIFSIIQMQNIIHIYNCENRSYTYTLTLGARYYYGMKRSIHKKTSGNNFNGNYFEFNIGGLPSIERSKSHVSNPDSIFQSYYSSKYTSYLRSTQISWGFQRRLNNYSFIDAKFLVGFSSGDLRHTRGYYVGLNLILGFGYNIKRK